MLAEGKGGAFGSSWVSSTITKKGTVDPQGPKEDNGVKKKIREVKTVFIMKPSCCLPLLSCVNTHNNAAEAIVIKIAISSTRHGPLIPALWRQRQAGL